MKRPLRYSRILKLFCYPALFVGLCLVAVEARSEIMSSQRTVLHDDIVHYTFDLDLGPGEFDMVRLHRVVRERRPGKPIATLEGIFLLPGAPNFFETIFMEPLISAVPPWDQSVAVFLARNDIDVWGMDYAWAMVPLETSDFGFMQDWGLGRDIDYAEQAIAAVRSIRRATGKGDSRLKLLGFSFGVPIAYAIAGNETLLPPGQRNVNGLISVDNEVKFNDEGVRLLSCGAAAVGQSQIEGGTFQFEDGVLMTLVGQLAKYAPDDPSPIFPAFTNWQFALYAGASGDPDHYVGGEFDQFGIPTGLRFTDPQLWVDLMLNIPPYMPLQALVDMFAIQCDEVDVPFDDRLGDITIPILAVGAAGGSAPEPYTPWLTGSQDIEHFTVQLLPDEERFMDFGHADIFMATNAEELVWQQMLDWLLAHRANRTYP